MFEITEGGVYIAGAQGFRDDATVEPVHPAIELIKIGSCEESYVLAGFRKSPATELRLNVYNSVIFAYAYSARKGASQKVLEELIGVDLTVEHKRAFARVQDELHSTHNIHMIQAQVLQHSLGMDFESAWATRQYGAHLSEYRGLSTGEGMRQALFEFGPDFI